MLKTFNKIELGPRRTKIILDFHWATRSTNKHMAKCCSTLRMIVLTFLGTEQNFKPQCCCKAVSAGRLRQRFRDCVRGEQLLQRYHGPLLPYSWTWWNCASHHEGWEKEKTPLPFQAFQEKAFHSSPCLWGRKGGSPRPSMTRWPCATQQPR